MSDKYPYWCVQEDCGISDCNECPFSPVVQYEKIKEQEKEFNTWKTEDYTEKENAKEIAELKFNINNLVKFQEGYINRIINLESVLTKNLKFWVEKAFWDKNREFFNGLLKELSSEGDSLPRHVIPHCEDIDEEGECTSLGGLCMDNLNCENKEAEGK